MSIIRAPEWGIAPVPEGQRRLGGRDYFILWSSLGVGLLVLSAGSFLSEASFIDAVLAIVAGSVGGSLLLALAGKIGSDHGITSLVSMRPSLGIRGSYAPAVLNILQLVGWTTFEIMIMARAADLLVGNYVPYAVWAGIFGALVALLAIAGPLAVARQWLGKFAVWIAYGTSTVIIVTLLMSPGAQGVISSPGKGMSFFTALDLVIAMPISWMPLAADYNRFAKKGSRRRAFWATMVGFALTNILFYFGGVLLGTFDVVAIIIAIQAIFFGFLMLLLIVDEADNAFADVYSAAVSAQDIFSKVGQKHLIVGFTAVSTALAMFVTIQDYETFLLLIGAVFVPLFGVVLTDYYVVRRQRYSHEMMYGSRTVRWPAIAAWAAGTLLNFAMSPLSPIFVKEMPAIGATVPSLAAASLIYLALVRFAKNAPAAMHEGKKKA